MISNSLIIATTKPASFPYAYVSNAASIPMVWTPQLVGRVGRMSVGGWGAHSCPCQGEKWIPEVFTFCSLTPSNCHLSSKTALAGTMRWEILSGAKCPRMSRWGPVQSQGSFSKRVVGMTRSEKALWNGYRCWAMRVREASDTGGLYILEKARVQILRRVHGSSMALLTLWCCPRETAINLCPRSWEAACLCRFRSWAIQQSAAATDLAHLCLPGPLRWPDLIPRSPLASGSEWSCPACWLCISGLLLISTYRSLSSDTLDWTPQALDRSGSLRLGNSNALVGPPSGTTSSQALVKGLWMGLLNTQSSLWMMPLSC